MRLKTFLAAAAVLTFTTTLAIADPARQAAQQCALNTNAPGNYNISNAPGLPHVIPGQGGTAAGAARINDCLAQAPAPPVDPNAAIYVGCSRRGGGLSKGNSLCVSP